MEEKFESWALVELYGHNRIVGKVTEATIGGCAFIRVDVPAINDKPGFTRYFGNNAIYSLSPVSEEIAMHLARGCRTVPVQPYELPAPKAAPAAAEGDNVPAVNEVDEDAVALKDYGGADQMSLDECF